MKKLLIKYNNYYYINNKKENKALINYNYVSIVYVYGAEFKIWRNFIVSFQKYLSNKFQFIYVHF